MKNKKYHIALNDREYAEIISSLINKRNSLMETSEKIRGVCYGYHSECRCPVAEPYGKDDACK